MHPYEALAPHARITIASPDGGRAPLDPASVESFKDDAPCVHYLENKSQLWETTEKLDTFLGRAKEFDAIFYVGGHAPMLDLTDNTSSIKLIEEFYNQGKIVSAVCHGPCAFLNVKLPSGEHLLLNQPVTGFSDTEEEATGLVDQMPFSLQSRLNEVSGGKFEKAQDWGARVCEGRQGRLFTGQNPASAGPIGEAIRAALQKN